MMDSALEGLLHPAAHWTSVQVFEFFGVKALLAAICGGIVGLERELKGKSAGIKTNILICLGSTFFTAASVVTAMSLSDHGHFGDPTRIASQIVSGIGFLGGGAIIQSRGTILGLTTAATIWVVAAIGILVGLGYHEMAVALSIFTVLILVGVSFFEDKVIGRSISFLTELVVEDSDGEVREAINEALARHDLVLDSFDIQPRGSEAVIKMKYSGHRRDQNRFSLSLWSIRGVKEIKQR